MLSDTAFRAAVNAGGLELTYSFLPGADDHFIQLSRPAKVDEDPDAQRFFERNLTRSRLALTLGPLVKPLTRFRFVPRSQRYADLPQIVDLRRLRKGWVLSPGESAVVFTNEYVRLSPDLVGMIIGRVSSYHTGLITATSYVDSTWVGLIELHVVNTAQRSVRLRTGMEIGRLFLVRSEGGSANGSGVSQRGLHYGFAWPRILSDEVDPFPHGSTPRARPLTARLERVNGVLQRYAGYGLAALLLAAAGAGVSLYGEIEDTLAVRERVDAHAAHIDSLRERTPVTGVEEINGDAGGQRAEVQFDLPAETPVPTAGSYMVAHILTDSSNATATVNVRSTGGRPVLALVVVLPVPTTQAQTLEVSWIYVP